MKPPTIYLAGPINGCSNNETINWRVKFIEDNPNYTYLDPMRRDYRGKEDESVTEIVEGDIADIDESDVFLANCWQVSWGTGMEIFYASTSGKIVIAVVPEGQRVSPWLRHHATVVKTLDEASRCIHRWQLECRLYVNR